MQKTQPTPSPSPCKGGMEIKRIWNLRAEVSMVAPLCCSSHWPVVLLPALATEAQIPISFLIGQVVLQHHGNKGRGTSLQNLSHHLPGVELRSKGGAGDAKETGSPILSSQLGGEPPPWVAQGFGRLVGFIFLSHLSCI